MKLIENIKYKIAASKTFELNKEINFGKETITIDYVAYDKNGKIIIYGFDLPDDNITKENIVDFLNAEKLYNNDSSIMHRLFSFYENNDNPIPFLVTNNKLYYLPNGIRQMNFNYWEETENIDTFLKIQNEINLKIEADENAIMLFEIEEQNEITIRELERIYPKNQIDVLTKKNPFGIEEEKYEQIPIEMGNGRYRTKHTINKITRMCILQKNHSNIIKVKVSYDQYIYYIDLHESFYNNETYYFLISETGQIEMDSSKQSNDEVYFKIKLENLK